MLNGILILDKPAGWTSFDVCAKLRGLLRERRIGHSGTLDPMATGVLPVFVGKATRACEFAQSSGKEYLARFVVGIDTDTQDTTGRVLSRSDRRPSPDEVRAALAPFTGHILQVPPMYSAVKVDGKRLYKLARAGAEVAREARPVTVESLALTGYYPETDEYEIRVVCSKGTYVRTLCHDIGMELASFAAMSALRRLRSGVFPIEASHTLEEIAEASASARIEELILPVDSLFSYYPAPRLDDRMGRALKNGAPLPPLPYDGEPGLCRVFSEDGEFLMLGELIPASGGAALKRIKSFY